MTNKTISNLLCSGLVGATLVGGAIVASAELVTFEANMSYQAELGNFTPGVDSVEAHGSFNGWGALVLTNVPGTTNYRNTLEITGAAGASFVHKFVNTRPGAANSGWESGGDRRFQLTGSPSTVSRYYEDSWGAGDYYATLTFQVDMGPQIAALKFDPATQTVNVRGTPNSWSATSMTNNPADPVNPNLYSMTIEWYELRAPGAPVDYKFRIEPTTPAEAGWESDPNRVWPLSQTPETIPSDCFNRACSVPVKARIHFQVDMRAQLIANFDTNTEAAYVRGNVYGWNAGEGLLLTEDASRPGIFTNTWSNPAQLIGETIEYKYVIYDAGSGSTKWEDGGNKSLVFTGTEPLDSEEYRVKTTALAYWNNISVYDLLPLDTLVTFQVSMTNATGVGGSPVFDPAVDSAFVNGSFTLPTAWWGWGSGGDANYLLATNGSGSLVYTTTQLIAKGKPVRLTYKYSINGADNEAATGLDHVRYIRTTGDYTLPMDVFGQQIVEPEVGSLIIGAPSGGYVLLSWNGRPGVHLQSNTSLTGGTWADDWSTDGLSSKSVSVGSGQFFRLVKPN